MNQNRTNSNFLIVGDFNLPFIKWIRKPSDLIEPVFCDNQTAQALTECINYTGLQQFNLTHNYNNTILDLVFSNMCSPCIKCSETSDILVKIDKHHPALEIVLNFKAIALLKEHKMRKRNYRKSKFNNIRQDLSEINWMNLFQDLSIDDSVSKFYETLNQVIEKHVPLVSYSENSYPSWFTIKTINLINIKNRFRKMYKANQDIEYYQMFSKIRSKLKQAIKIDRINYIRSTENCIQKNPKKFWSDSKSLRKCNAIPANMHLDSVLASNSKDISNLFADFFESTYNSSSILRAAVQLRSTNISSSFLMCKNEILNELLSLNAEKGCGPDLIPPVFIKETAEQLCDPLEVIFNKSLNEGFFPSMWKSARITPVHKAGEISNVRNYRPIQLLNCFAKIFERIFGLIRSNLEYLTTLYMNERVQQSPQTLWYGLHARP